MQHATIRLTDAQVAAYHHEGFLCLLNLTTSEEVEQLCGIYDRLFEIRAGRERGDHLDLSGTDEDDQPAALPQILNPSKYAPELAATQFRTNAEAVAIQLLGDEAVFRFDHAIRKPPHTGAETPWHQDEAYWEPDLDYNELSIWIPLQESTLDNGCMHFVSRSHAQDVQPHHSIGHDPRVVGLEVDEPATLAALAVPCPIPPGGATIHHCRTLHYAGPNRSDAPRRAYIIAFGTPPQPRAMTRNFYWLAQQQTKWQARRAAEASTSTGSLAA